MKIVRKDNIDSKQVPSAPFHVLSSLVEALPGFWQSLGQIENYLLDDKLADIDIKAPVFVTGMARSGSTVLSQFLSEQGRFASPQYKDYPLIHTPYFWNWFLGFSDQEEDRIERSHLDGLLVNSSSTEAMDEVLWQQYFPLLMSVNNIHILNSHTENKEFEAMYRDYLKKIILVRKSDRYLAKGNYLLNRIEYLLKLFPDAKFLIPFRDPKFQIASLVKQHELISRYQKQSPKARAYMQRLGHYEFGLDRRALNAGNAEDSLRIQRLFDEEKNLEAYARQWEVLYRQVVELKTRSPELKASISLVSYEDLCANPVQSLQKICHKTEISDANLSSESLLNIFKQPNYYHVDFLAEEEGLIEAHCSSVWGALKANLD